MIIELEDRHGIVRRAVADCPTDNGMAVADDIDVTLAWGKNKAIRIPGSEFRRLMVHYQSRLCAATDSGLRTVANSTDG